MSQTVERALRVLESIAEEPRTIEEVAELMGVHPSTALRSLQVLEARRLVVRDTRHVFRLGSGLFALANEALEKVDLRSTAEPHLNQLNRDVGHTVHLAILEGDQVIYVDKRESLNPVRMWSRIGNVAPMHCTAVAKAIVAFLPRSEQERLAGLVTYEPFTKNTITSADRFLAELEATAERGFALDHLEHEDFVNCMGAPIRGASGEILGSVSITTTTLLCTYEQLLGFEPVLAAAAQAISIDYGWQPPP